MNGHGGVRVGGVSQKKGDAKKRSEKQPRGKGTSSNYVGGGGKGVPGAVPRIGVSRGKFLGRR